MPRCPRYQTARGKCSEHLAEYGASASRRGYGTMHRWWRQQVLLKHPLCVGYPTGQHARTCDRIARVADHVTPLPRPNWRGGDWSIDNGQGLSIPCHNVKTASERRG